MVAATFVHGDWMHVIGNLWFLWVFGRSVEIEIGTFRYVAAFAFLGIPGFAVHWAFFSSEAVPVVGASGAISLLMGAYLVLFPGTSVRFLLVLGWVVRVLPVPAWIGLLSWAVLQIADMFWGNPGSTSIAYAAHFGGFATGALAGLIWRSVSPDPQLEAAKAQSS